MKNWGLIVIQIFVFILTSCDNEEIITSRNYPRILTLPVTEVTSDSVMFNGNFLNRGKFEILQYGFVWDHRINPNIDDHNRVIVSRNISDEKFSQTIRTTLKEGVTYFVRAFVKTNDYLVYGETVRFVSLGSGAPSIKSVFPVEINYCDTLYISGENFSYIKDQITVKFGSQTVECLSATDTLLKVIIPGDFSQAIFDLKVGIIENYSLAEKIRVKAPEIVSTSQNSVVFGDTILIHGNNFSPVLSANIVSFGSHQAEVIESTCELLKIIVPVFSESKISVTNSAGLKSGELPIMLKAPSISSISQTEGYISDLVVIEGENFGKLNKGFQVFVGEVEAIAQDYNQNKIVISVPQGIYENREQTISIKLNEVDYASIDFKLLDAWIQKNDLPIYNGVISFQIGDEGFMISTSSTIANENEVWKYNIQKNEWFRMKNFPGGSPGFAFTVDGDAYIAEWSIYSSLKSNVFWKYESESDEWAKLKNMPLNDYYEAVCSFSYDHKAYILTIRSDSNFWSYSHVTDEWELLPDFKSTFPNYYDGTPDMVALSGDKAYLLTLDYSSQEDELWEYSMVSGLWERKGIRPGNSRRKSGLCLIGDELYVFSGQYPEEFYKYNIGQDEWSQLETTISPRVRSNPVIFTLNQKVYYGGGWEGLSDFWEFDPAYLK